MNLSTITLARADEKAGLESNACFKGDDELFFSLLTYSFFNMWHPNEQLLLRAAVRFKKHDGTLFVTPRRVAWQQQGSSQLTPSIYYNDILGTFDTFFFIHV